MTTIIAKPCLLFVAILGMTTGLLAQTPAKVEFPAPSPTATLKQRIGLTDVEIVYSRPGVKGRQIFGVMEAYGKIWRTGANASTKITFSTPVKLNGNVVPAGKYALYTIPDEKEWTVILTANTALWGSYKYEPKDDVARFKVTPVKLPTLVETFTIDFGDIRDSSATLNLTWEKTNIPIKFEVDVVSTLVPQIEAVMASSDAKKPYHAAADFYFNHGLDLQKARTWIDAAVNERPNAFWSFHLQAKILAKLGDKAGAIAAAKKSAELAVKAEGPQSSFVQLNDALISSLN